MTRKDYYEILGVARDATDKQIKAAYRRLARKYHPDVNTGDKNAEEKFKEVAEAFAVLSDSQKRATYDRGGHDAFGSGFDPFAGVDYQNMNVGFGDMSDLFASLFGGFGGRASSAQRPRRGEDLQRRLQVAFDDAVRGTTLEFDIPRKAACGGCNGAGVVRGSGESACPECRGAGRVRQSAGGLQMQVSCGRCGGAGRIPGASCSSCGGSGRAAKQERVKVRIPPGVNDGSTLRLAGKGDAGNAGAPSGDLFLRVEVGSHPVFRREGRDLVCDVEIGLARAALGGVISVPTLNGPAQITIPEGTRSGQKFRLRGKGVGESAGRPAGDLYAVIQIRPPRKLDARSRELLLEFEQLHPDPG